MNGLSLRNVSTTLGDFRLEPISMDLDPGDYTILMGPSGCGKTTLLRTIAGMHPEHQGEIRVGDRSLTGVPTQKRGVGYVSQTAALFPHLTVRRNIAFGLSYLDLTRDERAKRVQEIAELLGAEELLHRGPRTLSGGETRRVALARALIVNPDVLLLDEPLSMLDTNARTELLGVLQRVHAARRSVIIHVTHHSEEAWGVRGKCMVMGRGRLLQTGTVESVFRTPESPAVAEFLGRPALYPDGPGDAPGACRSAQNRP